MEEKKKCDQILKQASRCWFGFHFIRVDTDGVLVESYQGWKCQRSVCFIVDRSWCRFSELRKGRQELHAIASGSQEW